MDLDDKAYRALGLSDSERNVLVESFEYVI